MQFNKQIRKVTDESVQNAKRFVHQLPTQDLIAVFIAFALLPIAFLFEVTFVLSFWFQLFSEEWVVRVVPLLFLGFNVYANMYKTYVVGPNGKSSQLPSVLKPGHRYCHACNLNSPPRAYHCPVCNVCIFRRDHHCSFLSVCIGHFNQRYFLAAAVNLWIISATCMLWNWHFLWLAIPNFGVLQLWHLMLPHIAFTLRFITFYQFFSIMVFVSSATTVAFVTYLIGAQIFCFYRGQTRVEYLLDIYAYNLGFLENVRQALGRRWYLVFISPFIPSPLESDGLSYRVCNVENKESKDVKYL
uniref:Palmitoyltransferase n=2 Tax=Acrobeloides nanus TaxID=290746 RepID=A0A914DL43_9BILA